MLQAELLAQEFLTHVATRPSGYTACSVAAAFEAWFQVESAHMLLAKGLDCVRVGYDHPDSRQKRIWLSKVSGGFQSSSLSALSEGPTLTR